MNDQSDEYDDDKIHPNEFAYRYILYLVLISTSQSPWQYPLVIKHGWLEIHHLYFYGPNFPLPAMFDDTGG